MSDVAPEMIKAAEVAVKIGELETKYQGQMDELKTALGAANANLAARGEVEESQKAEIASMVTKMADVESALQDMQQKNGELSQQVADKQKSFAQKFAESDAVKAYANKTAERAVMTFQTKDITSDGSGTEGNMDAQHLFRPERKPGIFSDVQDTRFFIQDVMPVVTVGSDSVEYVVDKTTDADRKAGKQAQQKGLKPELSYQFELRTAPICQLAAWICIARQALADASQLQGHIEGRLRYGLELEKEMQLLTGDGLNGNINGLTNQATTFSGTLVGTENKFDKVQKCIVELRNKFFNPDLIVMHPNDWCECVIAKASGDGHYFGNSPFDTPPTMSMWGLQVVLSTLIPENSVYVLDRMMAGQVMLRDSVDLRMTDSHEDLFVKNAVVMLIEQRVGLCITNPLAICVADIS